VENQTALLEVKRDVHKLCARVPLYASRLAEYDQVLARA
jgi:hypothetical protein